jgi:hypothetical protein
MNPLKKISSAIGTIVIDAAKNKYSVGEIVLRLWCPENDSRMLPPKTITEGR